MKLNSPTLCAAVVGLGMVINGFTADAANLTLRNSTAAAGTHGAIGGLSIPFSTNCASGFSMAGKKLFSSNKWTDWYVCSTPVLVCPKQTQANGKASSVHPKAIVQMIGGNPDGGAVKFRVQYKCDYGYTPTPAG